MAEFCHPEFGCDCSNETFTQDEWKAIRDAVEQYEDEFGFKVGEGKSLGSYLAAHPKGNLDDYYAASSEACDRGDAVRERLNKLAGLS